MDTRTPTRDFWIPMTLLYQSGRFKLVWDAQPLCKVQVYDRFDGMCGGRNLPITSIFRVSKSEANNVCYLNVTTTVKEDIDEKLWMNMRIIRCSSKENLDTCEDYIAKNNLPYCQIIDPNLGVLNPMFINYNPPYKCPIKKCLDIRLWKETMEESSEKLIFYQKPLEHPGLYVAVNSRIDGNSVIGFPRLHYYWRVVVNVTTRANRYMQCLKIDVHSVKKAH